MRSGPLLLTALLTVSCGGNDAARPPASELDATTTTADSPSTTTDVDYFRAEGSRFCVEVISGSIESQLSEKPGLLEDFRDSDIDTLIESHVQTFADKDFPDAQAKAAATAGCREGLVEYYQRLLSTTTVLAAPVEVARYSGSSDTETDDFTVSGTWRLTWEVTGGAGIGVTVRGSDGRQVDYISIDPGSSSSQFRTGCTCYLDISSFGATYDLVVTDIP